MSAPTVPTQPPESSHRAPRPPRDTETIQPEPVGSWSFLAHSISRTGGAPPTVGDANLSAVPLTRPELPGYEIIGELGRGGMGVVYQARQVKLNRLVALKMIIAGPFAAPEDHRRFFIEAETIARLRHPNIVQIYDFGEHQGMPYFSLEYVEGGTLHRWLQTHRPTPREAAALLAPLARAIDYAHRQGVIHRDLKPANVLLAVAGSEPPVEGTKVASPPLATGSIELTAVMPKLTDFGLAKRAASDLTATGLVLGTPNYMAPEQARGRPQDVSPALDIYALGAILYELLTGRPPFVGVTTLDVLEQLNAKEPTPPGRLRSGIPRALETICLTCLAKQPARRYASAGILADDLTRFLRGEPILARRTGRLERAWLWCRRNPLIAALTMLLAAGFVGLAVESAYLLGNISALGGALARIEQQRDVLRVALEQARQERQRADANLQQARATVEAFARAVHDSPLLRQPGMQPVQRALIDIAARYHAQFVADNADRPELQVDLVRTLNTQADLLSLLGAHAEAARCAADAGRRCETLLADDPASAIVNGLWARSQLLAARALNRAGQKEEGQRAYDRLIERTEARRALPTASALELAALANAYRVRASQEAYRGAPARAVETLDQTLALLRRLDLEANADLQNELAGALHERSIFERMLGRLRASVQTMEEALAVQRQLIDREPANQQARLQVAMQLSELATTWQELKDPARALALQSESTAALEKLARENPAVPEFRVRLGQVLSNRANSYLRLKDLPAAQADLAAAIRQQRLVLEAFPGDRDALLVLGFGLLLRGQLLVEEKQYEQALVCLQEAQPQLRRAAAAQPQRADLETYQRLARYYEGLTLLRLKRHADARPVIENLAEELERLAAAGPLTPQWQTVGVNNLIHLGKLEAAEGRLAQACDAWSGVQRLRNGTNEKDGNMVFGFAVALALKHSVFDQVSGAAPTPERERAKRQLADEATGLLHRAWKLGKKEQEQYETNPDLDSLRDHPAFKELLQEIRAARPAPAEPANHKP